MNSIIARLAPVAIAAFILTAGCSNDPAPTLPRTAEQFVEAHPDRADRLLSALDLSRPELAGVQAAFAEGDRVAASERLLAYYRDSGNGAWLRNRIGVHDPGGFDEDVVALADAALSDRYLLQGVSGTVARLSDGSIDWEDQGPKDDFQWAIFVNRHFILLPLQKAHAETGNAAYVTYINAFLQDWVINNYPAAEGETDKHLPANWRPMSSASRLLQVWPQLFYYFLHDDDFSAATRLMMLSSVPEQVEHLKRYHRRHHNHAIKEMAGMGHAAAAWPEFRDAAQWSEYSVEIMTEEISRQVYATGVQKELASHYHRTVLEYVAQYTAFSQAAGVALPADFVALIESMVDYLARSMTPDGHVILNNDSDRDFVRDKVATWADSFERDDWRYIASFGESGTAPDGLASSFYPYAGQLISRSDWSRGADWSYFDFGPWGVAHQHNDKLHVSLSVGDRNFLVDTGRAYYVEDDPLRQYVLGSSAHNVVLVDGFGQGPRPEENATTLADAVMTGRDFDYAIGSYTDGYPGLEGEATHMRGVLYLRDGNWIIVDRIETDRPREISALWHYHPDVTVGIDGIDTVTNDPGVTNLRMQPISDLDWRATVVSGQMEPVVRGWYSPVYNTVLPSPTVTYTATISGTAVFAWLITKASGDVVATDVLLHDADSDEIRFDAGDGDYAFRLADPARVSRDGTVLFPARETSADR